ncbi:MAG: hypothetical protein HYZ00_04965 [Candidatus Hydrogenedentes bacterium]|nr:hypothetical protein [Candidatus Hydrogenedentota bacterium]
MYDFWGNELRRFFQLETLSSAVDHMLRTQRDKFIVPSVMAALGPVQVKALHFELFQEGRFQLIFRVRASADKRTEASFALVVAKNHQECSLVARNEYNILQVLHERAPEHVVRPYRSGKIYLPDRHGRRELGREVFAYMTQWLEGFEELGVDKSLQFIINVQRRHVFSIAETEHLKGMIAEIIVRTYDPVQHTSMDMPEIASGDFVVRKSARGKLQLKLIACRRLLTRTGPARLTDKMLQAHWSWGQRTLELMPDDPAVFYQALVRALGEQAAIEWVRDYAAAVSSGKLRNRRPEYLEHLRRQVVT